MHLPAKANSLSMQTFMAIKTLSVSEFKICKEMSSLYNTTTVSHAHIHAMRLE